MRSLLLTVMLSGCFYVDGDWGSPPPVPFVKTLAYCEAFQGGSPPIIVYTWCGTPGWHAWESEEWIVESTDYEFDELLIDCPRDTGTICYQQEGEFL